MRSKINENHNRYQDMANPKIMTASQPILRSVSMDDYSQRKSQDNSCRIGRKLRASNQPPLRQYTRCQSFPDNQQFDVEKSLDALMWRIEDGLLHELPPYYLLEKSHVVIRGICTSTVAHRVVECLRRLSVAATFDHHEATVIGETLNFVLLKITIFRQKDFLIVEISRTKGCPVKFSRVAHAVMAAVQGREYQSRYHSDQSALFVPLTFETGPYLRQSRVEIIESLRNIDHLLNNERWDAQLLGMESLQCITDATRTMHEVSRTAAKMVLMGEDNDILFRHVVIQALINNGEGYRPPIDKWERDHIEKKHRYALAILSNCLSQTSDDTLRHICENDSWFLGDIVLDILITELTRAPSKVHNAYWAAKCLAELLRASHDLRCRARNGVGVREAVQLAQFVGLCGHELLEKEASFVLELLGGDDQVGRIHFYGDCVDDSPLGWW